MLSFREFLIEGIGDISDDIIKQVLDLLTPEELASLDNPSPETNKKIYRRLAKELHPDITGKNLSKVEEAAFTIFGREGILGGDTSTVNRVNAVRRGSGQSTPSPSGSLKALPSSQPGVSSRTTPTPAQPGGVKPYDVLGGSENLPLSQRELKARDLRRFNRERAAKAKRGLMYDPQKATTPAQTGPTTVKQAIDASAQQAAQQAAEQAKPAGRVARGAATATSLLGGGLGSLAYGTLVPQEFRDWAQRSNYTVGETNLSVDDFLSTAAFQGGMDATSAGLSTLSGGALGTPLATAAKGFLPNVVGGVIGSQEGERIGSRLAQTLGGGELAQGAAGLGGGVLGWMGGAKVARDLMTKAGREGMKTGMKGLGKGVGAAGAILDTAFTAADQFDTKYKGLGGELESILDPGDLLALSGGPVGLAAFVGTKGLKVGGAISRAAIDAEQQKKNKLATDLTNAISTLQNTDWSKQPKGAKEQWEKYTRDLEAQRKNMTTIFGDEKKAVELASQEGMRDFNFTYNPQTKGLQFQSDVADERKRRAQDTARASGATPAEFKDIEQRLQVAALKKQAEEAPKTAEGRARIKEVESQEQAAQRFAAQDAVRQAREAGYEPDPELLKQAAGPIEKDPNAKESAQTAIDAEVEGIRAKENEQMQQAQRKEEERKAKNAAAEKKLADARIGDSEAAQTSRNLEAMSKKLREMPSLEQQIQMAKDKLKSR